MYAYADNYYVHAPTHTKLKEKVLSQCSAAEQLSAVLLKLTVSTVH